MIQFEKSLPSNKILWAFNNNTLKYRDTSVNANYSDIDCGIFSVRLRPDPSGFFFFNFLEHLKKVIAKDFEDTADFTITGNPLSLIYNATTQNLLNLNAAISFTDGDFITNPVIVPLQFMAGVMQIEQYQKGETYQEGFFMLSYPNRFTNQNYKINYWPGYPFDFTLFSDFQTSLSLRNLSTEISLTLPINHKVFRIAFGDGSHDETIEDHLPLVFGLNTLKISVDTTAVDSLIARVVKHPERCGIYIKFRNQYGGWSYWLFNQRHLRTRTARQGEEIENDWKDIFDTTSTTIQSGVDSSHDTLRLMADRLDEEDVRVLSYLIESPKIYLYTAPQYSEGRQLAYQYPPLSKRWIAVKCLTSSLDMVGPGKKRYSMLFYLALPKRYKISLL